MNIWLIKDGEPVIAFEPSAREMRTTLIAKYLSKRGHNVTLWCSNWSHYNKKKYTNKDSAIYDNKNKFNINIIKSVGYKKNISLRRLIHYSIVGFKFYLRAKKLPTPDLIISSLPSIELSFAATCYSIQYRSELLIDLRDMWPDIFLEIFPKSIRFIVKPLIYYQFYMMKHICNKCSGFIAITEPYLDWAKSYITEDKVNKEIVLPLVYPKSIQTNNPNAQLLNKFYSKEIDFEKFNLVFAGSFSPRAFDLETIISAMNFLPDNIQLLIAGKSLDDKSIENNLRDMACGDKVKFLGWLNARELQFIYSHSNIALAPYKNNNYFKMNLTNKPIEYLSYGLPILTCNEGYLSSLLKSYNCGFLYNENSSKEFAELVLDIFSDKIKYELMRKNCLDLYKSKFDFTTAMDKFSNYLESHGKQ